MDGCDAGRDWGWRGGARWGGVRWDEVDRGGGGARWEMVDLCCSQ